MLPIFTTGQVKDGIDTGDLMLDLSDYMKKKDAATKVELNNLSAIVANKLDVEPQHSHHIEDIKQLQSLLDGKYDKSEKYSYNTILSNPEQIAYLEAPTVRTLNINDYTFYVDTNGDLMITLNNVLIGSYSTVSGKWSFETDTSNIENVLENHAEALNAVCNATLRNITDINTNSSNISENETKINSVESIINTYIAKTDAVLKNHYDAILLLCQKHGMIDSNENDEENITPEND
jgi:DNA repair ATPase RecN